MPAVCIKSVGWVVARREDDRPTNGNRVALRTGRGVRLTLRASDVNLPSERRSNMVETKRQRNEHKDDKGHAHAGNPRTHATEMMTAEDDRRFRAAQRRAADDGGKALADFDRDTDGKYRVDQADAPKADEHHA